MHNRISYGDRARIGLLVPPTNTVNETEWQAMRVDGVSFHTHRVALHSAPTTPEQRTAFIDDVAMGAAMLTPAGVSVIAYACTAASMVNPAEALEDELSERCRVKVVTTSAAILRALAHLDARNIAIATPYHDALNKHEVEFLASNGIHVSRIAGLGLGANGPSEYRLIAPTPLETVLDHARSVLVPGIDALLLACTDMRTLPLIDDLEKEIGVPVISSNTCTLWSTLRAAGINDKVAGAGILLGA